MMRKILYGALAVCLLAPELSVAAGADYDTLSEMAATVTASDFIPVFDASEADGSRMKKLSFDGTVTNCLTGLGTFVAFEPSGAAAAVIAAAVTESDTTHCPDGASVFTALAGKQASGSYEPALGNPGTTGWILSSTDAGVRSWVAAGAGDITGVLGDATGDVPVLYQTFTAFTGSDATPDVSTSSHWKNVDTTTINGFDGTPVDGQHLWVRCDYAGIFDITSSSIVALNRTTDYTCTVGEVHEFVYNSTSTKWVAKDLPNEIEGLTFSAAGFLGYNGTTWDDYYLDSNNFENTTGTWGIKDGGISAAELASSAVPCTTAAKTSAYTIGTDSAKEAYGGVIYVTSAATVTAPAVASGMSFSVVTIGSIAVSLDMNASDKMYLDGVLLDDGDKATNTSTAGDTITCTYFSADGFYCMSGSPDGDHWTDGGA